MDTDEHLPFDAWCVAMLKTYNISPDTLLIENDCITVRQLINTCLRRKGWQEPFRTACDMLVARNYKGDQKEQTKEALLKWFEHFAEEALRAGYEM